MDPTVSINVVCPDCRQQRVVRAQWRHRRDVQNRLCRSCAVKRGKSVYRIKDALLQQKRRCLYCEKEFIPNSGNQRYCSSECVQSVWRIKNKPDHRLVWERESGRLLPEGWVVHHLNGRHDDNRYENLVALPKGDHAKLLAAYKRLIRQLESKILQLTRQRRFSDHGDVPAEDKPESD